QAPEIFVLFVFTLFKTTAAASASPDTIAPPAPPSPPLPPLPPWLLSSEFETLPPLPAPSASPPSASLPPVLADTDTTFFTYAPFLFFTVTSRSSEPQKNAKAGVADNATIASAATEAVRIFFVMMSSIINPD
ncbi:hypothetical protein C4552_04155, partial [Candidatus Parcubacteria bacterium]